MTDEFNDLIRYKLNSISSLAIDTTPGNFRLQKLVTLVCDLLQVPAAILLLTEEVLLSPKVWQVGMKKEIARFLSAWHTQHGEEQVRKQFLRVSSPTPFQPVMLMGETGRERTPEFLVVPVAIGTQLLGVIAFAQPDNEVLRREKSSLLSLLAQQVGLLLLVLKDTMAEALKPKVEQDRWFIEDFLVLLSHELRSPLHAILGWASVLQHPATSKETEQQALKIIERSARAQSQIINELLDASFCLNQRTPSNRSLVPLQAILQQAMKPLLPLAEQKAITLTTDLQLADAYVVADVERLRRVFWHLLSNAIKFTMQGGKIQLSARRRNGHLEIVLTDSGIGIVPEFMPYVFAPFRQEDVLTTRKFGGLGLGLAIARHQIELHGGKIEISSAGRQAGTTVTVRLPLAPTLPVDQETDRVLIQPFEAKVTAEASLLVGLRVLVVDDDPDSLEIVSAILQNCHSEVQVANNALEALEVLKHWEPDIVISNLQMPGSDGYEMIRHIRHAQSSFQRPIATIAMTDHTKTEDRLKALASGFHTHLSKPINPTELVAVISSLKRNQNRYYC